MPLPLGYWLSSTDETPKCPRPPLTDAARWIYHSAWKKVITEYIELEDLTEITVRGKTFCHFWGFVKFKIIVFIKHRLCIFVCLLSSLCK